MRHIPALVAAITIAASAAEKPGLPRLQLPGNEQRQGILAQDTGKLMPSGQMLFSSGRGGYHTYRIPALAVTPKSKVPAFCEGREQSGSDTGDIDLLMKRSTDQGTTWSEPQVIFRWQRAELETWRVEPPAPGK